MDVELDPALALEFGAPSSLPPSASFFLTAAAGSEIDDEVEDSRLSGLLCVEEASEDCSSSE